MFNAWFQESGGWKLWCDGACIFINCDLLFQVFEGSYFLWSIFKQKWMV